MIVGIDLGTTNSLVAYFDKDKAEIIPNRLGEHLTPSVVAIDETDTILVGRRGCTGISWTACDRGCYQRTGIFQ